METPVNKSVKDKIILIAHQICKSNFMDFPDYEEKGALNIADALTIIISEQLEHDTELANDEIHDYLTENIKI